MHIYVIVTARNEAERIHATLLALAAAFPGASVWVADDGSTDETSAIARRAGATVVRSERAIGKGGAATLAAYHVLGRAIVAGAQGVGASAAAPWDRSLCASTVVLCDGDHADVAVAIFSRRIGGGLGFAVGFARWAIRKRCGLDLKSPLSGQRALRGAVLDDVLPFAHGFGMEVGMTIDATRAGRRVMEVELDLEHRPTGRTLSGFAHRGRQLLDGVRAYVARL
jgi:Glycosyl transferase family 2